MTTDRATGIETTGPTDDESNGQVTQLLRRVEALEAEKAQIEERFESQLDDVRSELDETKQQHREDRHALARENHELRQSQQHLEERANKAEEKDSYLLDDILDLENQLADLEEGSADSKGGGNDAETTPQRPDLTPIERLSIMDAEDTGIEVTASIERAIAIFEHWEEWSSKTPKGRVLKDGQKSLLRTATGEQLGWRQVYRAAEALEELSKGRIQFIHHNRHGKMLIEPTTPERDCHASSAATT